MKHKNLKLGMLVEVKESLHEDVIYNHSIVGKTGTIVWFDRDEKYNRCVYDVKVEFDDGGSQYIEHKHLRQVKKDEKND